jgi:hypothetical protein
MWRSPVLLVGSSGTEGSIRRASVPIPPWMKPNFGSALRWAER